MEEAAGWRMGVEEAAGWRMGVEEAAGWRMGVEEAAGWRKGVAAGSLGQVSHHYPLFQSLLVSCSSQIHILYHSSIGGGIQLEFTLYT